VILLSSITTTALLIAGAPVPSIKRAASGPPRLFQLVALA
jgi:hypothetical protein